MKILNYLAECSRLDTTPNTFPLSDEQFDGLIREFSKENQKKQAHGNRKLEQIELGLNLLSVQGRCTVKKEVPAKQEMPILAIELDGREHYESDVVQARDRKKEEICRTHNFELIRVDNSYARRYHHIRNILMEYFKKLNGRG